MKYHFIQTTLCQNTLIITSYKALPFKFVFYGLGVEKPASLPQFAQKSLEKPTTKLISRIINPNSNHLAQSTVTICDDRSAADSTHYLPGVWYHLPRRMYTRQHRNAINTLSRSADCGQVLRYLTVAGRTAALKTALRRRAQINYTD